MSKYHKNYIIYGINFKMKIKIYNLYEKKCASVYCKKLDKFFLFDIEEDLSINDLIMSHFTREIELMFINNPLNIIKVLGDNKKTNSLLYKLCRYMLERIVLVESPDPNDSDSFMIGINQNFLKGISL